VEYRLQSYSSDRKSWFPCNAWKFGATEILMSVDCTPTPRVGNLVRDVRYAIRHGTRDFTRILTTNLSSHSIFRTHQFFTKKGREKETTNIKEAWPWTGFNRERCDEHARVSRNSQLIPARITQQKGIRTTMSRNRLHESFGKFYSYFEEDFKDQQRTKTSKITPKFWLFVVNAAVTD